MVGKRKLADELADLFNPRPRTGTNVFNYRRIKFTYSSHAEEDPDGPVVGEDAARVPFNDEQLDAFDLNADFDRCGGRGW